MTGDEKSNAFVEVHVFSFGFTQKNGDAHFQFGRFYCNRQAPTEARYQTVFHTRDLPRIRVTGDHDLFAWFQQGIEGIEKLFLSSAFSAEKLDVID